MRFTYKRNTLMTVCPHEFVIPDAIVSDVFAANALVKEALAWCKETFPESKRTIRFYHSSWNIWFVREKDALHFRLRWC
ncbi:MAG: hypothetical protein EOP83_01915 [Verrucomicrobiaceae bacterium]|nr:MAG: hypothetical protein EOP83_01915 [Verrucomicrobiaceae bacterium]